MFKNIISFFIPGHTDPAPELYRRYKLVAIIVLITFLYDLNYAGTTVMIGMTKATPFLLFTALINLVLLFLLRQGLQLTLTVNLYAFFGVIAILMSIYHSGGFHSPVLPWLATTPIVAMLMAGRKTGIFWAILNSILVIALGTLDKAGYHFPYNYDRSWENMLSTNCYAGLVLIIFFAALVFENGKNTALNRLAENNLLLAEEKKKTALNEISQEIHDNVGHTLSVAKLNLHLVHHLEENQSRLKLQETVELVGKAISDLRNISHSLYSDNIVRFDLEQSIDAELQTIKGLGTYQISYSCAGAPKNLSPQTQFILFRIFKEAVNNIIKHAEATLISIELDYTSADFNMQIKDNGRGMSAERRSSYGQGITNIKDRVNLLQGTVEIESGLTKGTCIRISIPNK